MGTTNGRTTQSAASRFRQLLREPGIIMAPGAYDCLTAKIIQQAGFPAVYMTGAGTSVAQLGYPDLALATMTEMVSNAANIAEAVDVPVIADADTGYGGVLNVQRTVRQYQRAGVAAIHIEDQEFPKRCGHLDDKRVVSQSDMVRKIRAAVDARTDPDFTIIVRTDALAVTDWDDTMQRCQAYVEAGADMLFVEALRTSEQAERAARSFDVPLLYNFVETGKSPLLPAAELEKLGFKLVIFPVSALLTVCRSILGLMRELKETGTTAHLLDGMVSLEQCFETVGLTGMLATDAGYSVVDTEAEGRGMEVKGMVDV
ncbi:MAG: oxaloacetate decarboxylase [Chloroflexi bacterium]|nr:oxaloacetate decarboxylase [Chloroflexota bacterium]